MELPWKVIKDWLLKEKKRFISAFLVNLNFLRLVFLFFGSSKKYFEGTGGWIRPCISNIFLV